MTKKVVKEEVKCSVCDQAECVCVPEVELFVKLGKHTTAMVVPGGVVLEHKAHLAFLPGLKVLELGDKHVLVKI